MTTHNGMGNLGFGSELREWQCVESPSDTVETMTRAAVTLSRTAAGLAVHVMEQQKHARGEQQYSDQKGGNEGDHVQRSVTIHPPSTRNQTHYLGA
jgi:hypothetical protein